MSYLLLNIRGIHSRLQVFIEESSTPHNPRHCQNSTATDHMLPWSSHNWSAWCISDLVEYQVCHSSHEALFECLRHQWPGNELVWLVADRSYRGQVREIEPPHALVVVLHLSRNDTLIWGPFSLWQCPWKLERKREIMFWFTFHCHWICKVQL